MKKGTFNVKIKIDAHFKGSHNILSKMVDE